MKVKEKVSFNDLIQSETPVLIDFYADWCGPCIAMGPVLKQLASEMGEKVKIIKIDVDSNQAIAMKLNVQGIPTFMLFKSGELLWRRSGMMSKEQLKHMIEQHA